MSETSEGVEEVLSPREFREKCEDLRLYGAGDETGDPRATDKLAMSHEALRERLEEAREERDRWEAEAGHNLSIIRELRDQRDEARRRADRLEEAVREVLEEPVGTGDRDGPDSQQSVEAAGFDFASFEDGFSTAVDLIRDRLRSALDSREDEGEDCTCPQVMLGDGSWWGSGPNPGCPVHGEDDESCTCGPPRVSTSGSLGGTLPDVEGRRDPDCPVHGYDADATGSDSVHADEDEGDRRCALCNHPISDHPIRAGDSGRIEICTHPVHADEPEVDCTRGPPRVSTSGSLGGTLPDVAGGRDQEQRDEYCPYCESYSVRSGRCKYCKTQFGVSGPVHADEPERGDCPHCSYRGNPDPESPVDEFVHDVDCPNRNPNAAPGDEPEEGDSVWHNRAADECRCGHARCNHVRDATTTTRRCGMKGCDCDDFMPTDEPVSGEGEAVCSCERYDEGGGVYEIVTADPNCPVEEHREVFGERVVDDLDDGSLLIDAVDDEVTMSAEMWNGMVEEIIDARRRDSATHADARSELPSAYYRMAAKAIEAKADEGWYRNEPFARQVAHAFRQRPSTRPDPHGGERDAGG